MKHKKPLKPNSPPIFFERPHDQSIKASLVDKQGDGKKGCKQTNKQTVNGISLKIVC